MAQLIDDDDPLYPPLSAEEKARHRQHTQHWQERRAKLERLIVIDPKKLNGEPHIKGTRHTLKAIRAAWAERGVRMADMRKRFRSLTDDDLETALLHWSDPTDPPRLTEPGAVYIAEWASQPPRKIYLFRESPKGASPEWWKIAGYEIDDDGMELPLPDAVDEGFAAILRYITRYAPRDVIWRDEATNSVVDIYSMNRT